MPAFAGMTVILSLRLSGTSEKLHSLLLYPITSIPHSSASVRNVVLLVLLHPHARGRAIIRIQDIQILATGAGRQNHALGYAEAHLARRQIGHHDGQLALQIFRLVG